MPLPSSGQISFNDVRVETSQSAFTSYAFSEWASGYNSGTGNIGFSNADYAPINLISSGSGSGTNALRYSQNLLYPPVASSPYFLKLSDWYLYNHTASITTGVTASLYSHWAPFYSIPCRGVTSMVPVDVGTSNTTLNLNISGNVIYDDGVTTGCWMIFYGKPWTRTGVGNTVVTGCGYAYQSTSATLIASGTFGAVNRTIQYNYTYNASSGSFIYYVYNRIYSDPCLCGGICP